MREKDRKSVDFEEEWERDNVMGERERESETRELI